MMFSHLKATGLKNSQHNPCLFVGTLIEGEPPIYVGIYVDNIIYFSASDAVEHKFENLLSTIGDYHFMRQVSRFLGIKFTWVYHNDGHLSVSLTQQSFAETLIESLGLYQPVLQLFLLLIVRVTLLIWLYIKICHLLTEMHYDCVINSWWVF
jgi:hypothetical protein